MVNPPYHVIRRVVGYASRTQAKCSGMNRFWMRPRHPQPAGHTPDMESSTIVVVIEHADTVARTRSQQANWSSLLCD